MSCSHNEETLALWAGGELYGSEAEDLQRHLTSCAGCRRLAGELRETQRTLAAARLAEPNRHELHHAREAALERIRRGRNGWLGGARIWQAAASVAVLSAIGLWWAIHEPGHPEPVAEPKIASEVEPGGGKPEEAGPVGELVASQPVVASDGDPRRREQAAAEEPVHIARSQSVPVAQKAHSSLATVEESPVDDGAGYELLAVHRESSSAGGNTHGLMVKVPSDDPDIVMYWVLE